MRTLQTLGCGNVFPSEAVRGLVKALKDTNASVHQLALLAIPTVNPSIPRPIDDIVALLKAPHVDMQMTVPGTMVKLSPHMSDHERTVSVAALGKATQDKDGELACERLMLCAPWDRQLRRPRRILSKAVKTQVISCSKQRH